MDITIEQLKDEDKTMAQYVDIIVPELSDGIDDVQITNWLKNEGDPVSYGEAIVELEVNKSAVELESPADGVLDAIYCFEGEEVICTERIGVILLTGDEGGEEFDFEDSEKYNV